MAVKTKSTKEKPQILEGFTYEELPSGEVEIPQEVLDNSVVIDVKELRSEAEEKILDEAGVQPLPGSTKVELKIEGNDEEPKVEKKKSNEVQIEVPGLKEKKKTISRRRNSSRRIQLGGTSIDLDTVDLPDTITINHKLYAGLIKDYLFRAILLQLMAVLRDTADLSNEEMVDHIRENFPNIIRIVQGSILETHKMIEDIVITFSTMLDEEASEGNQSIINTIEIVIKFPEHVKTYESKDFVLIPV